MPREGTTSNLCPGGGGGEKERKGEGEAPSKKKLKSRSLKCNFQCSTLSSQNAIAATYVSETQTSEPAP